MEIADEVGISKEEITYAMDAIQYSGSLYEPVYTNGGDPLCVMDQIIRKTGGKRLQCSKRSDETASDRAPHYRYAVF